MNTTDTAHPPVEPHQDIFQTYSWEQGSMLPVTEGGDWMKTPDYRRTLAENDRLREQLAAVTAERDGVNVRWNEDLLKITDYTERALRIRLASGCPDGTALAEWVERLRRAVTLASHIYDEMDAVNWDADSGWQASSYEGARDECDAIMEAMQPPTSAPTDEQAPEGGA